MSGEGRSRHQGPGKRTKLVPFGQNGSPVGRPLGVSGARVEGQSSEQEPEVMCINESLGFKRRLGTWMELCSLKGTYQKRTNESHALQLRNLGEEWTPTEREGKTTEANTGAAATRSRDRCMKKHGDFSLDFGVTKENIHEAMSVTE